MKKRILMWAILLILFSLIVPIMAFGEDNINESSGYEYIVNEDGTASIVGCDDSINGEISIPEEIGGHTVASIGANAFSRNSRITGVTMPNTIQSIEHHAFFACGSLKYFKFSTGLKTVGASAFLGCGAEEINLPDNVSSIGMCAFGGDYLAKLHLPESLTRIPNEMIYAEENNSITELVIPSKVQEIGEYGFGLGYNIEKIYIPKSVKKMAPNYLGKNAYICYEGSVDDWNEISFVEGFWNSELFSDYIVNANLNMYFNSKHLHEVVTDKAVEANCNKTGLTEGKHCTTCGEVLIKQETIPNKHEYSSEIINEPTCSEYGEKRLECSICGDVTYEAIEKIEHTWGKWEAWIEQDDDSYMSDVEYIECHGGVLYRQCKECYEEEEKEVSGIGCFSDSYIDRSGEIWYPSCDKCGECLGSVDYAKRWPGFMKYVYSYDGDLYDKDKKTKVRTIFSKNVYFANGKQHKPQVSIYVYKYDENGDYVGREKLSSKHYEYKYSGNGIKAGTYRVTINFKGIFSGEIEGKYKVTQNPIAKSSLDLYKGSVYKLKRSDATGKITWKSSNRKVATVSSAGKVTAKGYGKCIIYAKSKGKTYKCSVTIPHHKPVMYCEYWDYSTRSNTVKVYIKNKGRRSLTIYSNGSKLIDFDYKSFDRNLKLANGKSKIILKPGKSMYVKYKVMGSTTWPDERDHKIRLKLSYDGKYYTKYAYY